MRNSACGVQIHSEVELSVSCRYIGNSYEAGAGRKKTVCEKKTLGEIKK